MKTVVGTCGICGGPVSVPGVWSGIIPPTPTCRDCGATAVPNHGPVMPMKPAMPTIVARSVVIDGNSAVGKITFSSP